MRVIGEVIAALLCSGIAVGMPQAGGPKEDNRQPCGTVLTREDIAREMELQGSGFWDQPTQNFNGGNGQNAPFVKMIFHVVRFSNGTGGISLAAMDQAVEQLNAAMYWTGHTFFVIETRVIDSDVYATLDLKELLDLSLEYGTEGVLDVFFVPDAIGICGVSTFPSFSYQGIAIDNQCVGPDFNTFPHEVGHYLWLYHTHETAFGHECCDGGNCDIAGDLLCDTAADPLDWTGTVDTTTCEYIGNLSSACSAPNPPWCYYDPPLDNIMSYAPDACATEFTWDQYERMTITLEKVSNRSDHVWYSQDCNVNDIPDPYDIAWGNSQDSNGNGIPDECEAGSIPNDECSTALSVTEGVYAFSTIGATTTQNQVVCVSNLVHRDLWYRWTAPACGEVRVTACGDGNGQFGDFVPSVVVYEGGCGSAQEACDNGGAGICASFGAEVVMEVEEGQEYTIMVGGCCLFEEGTGDLTIDFVDTGTTVYVPAHYPTIQAALDANRCIDEIRVASGTYTSGGDSIIEWDRDSDVVIRALSSNPGSTVLDCENARRCLISQGAGHVTLDGFTIRNGFAPEGGPIDSYGRGGAVWKYGGGLRLTNCVFDSNAAEGHGGAVFSIYARVELIDCAFSINTSQASGGAMFLDNVNGGANVLTGCTFTSNTSIVRGGACVLWNTQSTISDCTFTLNETAGNGGAIHANPGLHHFDGCVFTSNLALKGGGLYSSGATCSAISCTFESNTAGELGGGIYVDLSEFSFNDCTIRNNTAIDGGAGMFNNGSNPVLVDCEFTGNISGGSGGGIRNWKESSPHLTGCTFVGNVCTKYGAGAMANFYQSDAVVIKCTFDSNFTAVNGGAVYNYESNPWFSQCVFRNNAARVGGAVSNSHNFETSFSECLFEDNTATMEGGALWNGEGCSPLISGSEFVCNHPEHFYGGWTDEGDNIFVECCAGDLNGDGDVNGGDLGLLLASWGESGGDINGSGTTDGADMGLLLAAWGPCVP